MGSIARRTSRDGVVSQMQQQGSSHSGKEQITSQVDTTRQSLITTDQQSQPSRIQPLDRRRKNARLQEVERPDQKACVVAHPSAQIEQKNLRARQSHAVSSVPLKNSDDLGNLFKDR
jgi:hypothetical protein